jgi:hypothetical protein
MSMFTDKLVERAKKEFADYQGQFENAGELKQRIGTYWTFLHRPDLDGGDDIAWSAAFISYMVNLAGAGAQFPYSAQHSVYFYRTINDLLTRRSAPFLGYRVGAVEVRPGDIIGMNRGDAPLIDYDWASHHADYKSHADIVVDVGDDGAIRTLGGNVGQAPGQIAGKTFSMQEGNLVNQANDDQQVFVVIRSFLP